MLNELCRVVREVGELLCTLRLSGGADGYWEEGNQFKAVADQRAHEALVEKLGTHWPGIPVMSEELPTSWFSIRPERYFIIDPIDGTASYAQGFEGFVTQVALIEQSRPIVSAIFAPALNLFYSATLGAGAFLNGIPLQPLNTMARARTIIDNYPKPKGITKELFEELFFSTYIESGSISLKICRVADGTADIFFKDVPIRDWDIAAPHLILSQARGTLSDSLGCSFEYQGDVEHQGLIAAANPQEAERIVAWAAAKRVKKGI